MISSLIAQICDTVAGLFPGPLAFVGDLFGGICSQAVSLLSGIGL